RPEGPGRSGGRGQRLSESLRSRCARLYVGPHGARRARQASERPDGILQSQSRDRAFLHRADTAPAGGAVSDHRQRQGDANGNVGGGGLINLTHRRCWLFSQKGGIESHRRNAKPVLDYSITVPSTPPHSPHRVFPSSIEPVALG